MFTFRLFHDDALFWQLLPLEVHVCKYKNILPHGQNKDRISKLRLIDRIFCLFILTEGFMKDGRHKQAISRTSYLKSKSSFTGFSCKELIAQNAHF